MIYQVALAVLETFLMFAVGAILYRRKWLTDAEVGRLSNLTMEVFFPMLTFSSVFRNFHIDNLNEFWVMPLLGIGIMALGWGVGAVLPDPMRRADRVRRGTYLHLCAINNYLFLPLIVIGNLWGEREMTLLLVMSVGSTIGFWTVGIAAFGAGGDRSWSERLKRILLSPNLLAVAAGAGCAALPFRLPGIIAEPMLSAMNSMGKITVPLMLVLIGAALMREAKQLFSDWGDVLYISAIRLLALPLLTIAGLWLLPLDTAMYRVAVVVAVMPAASASVLMARIAGGSTAFAGQAIVWTTIFSLATMPLLIALAL